MMKTLGHLAIATAVALALGAGTANAASYAYTVLNTVNPFVGDLNNATAAASTGDARTIYDPNDATVGYFESSDADGFNTLSKDDFHINRTLFATTGGVAFEDRYLFDFATAPAGSSAQAHATVHYAVNENNAVNTATFSLFADLNNNGVADDGAALATLRADPKSC